MSASLRILSWLRLIFCVVNNFYAIPVYLACYVLLLPLRILQPRIFWTCEGWLYEKLLSMVAMWAKLSGHQIFISGDDITSITNDECIVMSNHQSSGDTAVLMHTLHSIQPALRHVMWIMDWILQFLSFGWVAKGHGDCFLLQGSDIRRLSFMLQGTEEEIKLAETDRLKKHIRKVYCERDRKWIVLFPEGGFLRKRKAGSHRFSQRHNLPLLNHVSMPRTGAIESIIEVLHVHRVNSDSSAKALPDQSPNVEVRSYASKKLKWIIDVTIGYRDCQPLSIGSWIMGHEGPKNIFLHFRVYQASELLSQTAGGEGSNNKICKEWIYNKFIEKERILQQFYTTGIFPAGKLGVKKLKFFTLETVIGHLFCIAPYILLVYCLF